MHNTSYDAEYLNKFRASMIHDDVMFLLYDIECKVHSDIQQIQLQSYATIVHSEYMIDCMTILFVRYPVVQNVLNVIHDMTHMTSFMQHLTSNI